MQKGRSSEESTPGVQISQRKKFDLSSAAALLFFHRPPIYKQIPDAPTSQDLTMNDILKKFLFVSSIYLLAPAAGAFSLNDTIASGTQALSSTNEVSGEAQQLLGLLEGQLGVTETQAVGGTSALLQLAKNDLGSDAMSTLTSQAPGLSSLLGAGSMSQGLLSGISSMDGVQSAFSALGMDSAMIQQFVPILMGFLGDQGVGSSLLGQLQSLWTPAS